MQEVGANSLNKGKKNETLDVNIDLHIGVFFDGTNNNANKNEWVDWFKLGYFRDRTRAYEDHINVKLKDPRKLSNPAILSSLFAIGGNKESVENTDKYLHVYIEGSGANEFQAENQALDFLLHGKPLKGLGFGIGSTGVVAKVSKAIKYVSERVEKEKNNNFTKIQNIHFYVFGFSRGSTCARLFSYIIAENVDEKVDRLPREQEFDKYLSKKYYSEKRVHFLEKKEELYSGKMTVDFLGIYDTVSAIGLLNEKKDSYDYNSIKYLIYKDDFWGNFHKNNSIDYGLFSPSLSNIVLSTCHICALDEFRANFALTDLGTNVPSNSLELFIPGCHSDVGGGYMANDKGETKTLNKIIESIWTKTVDYILDSDSSQKSRMYNLGKWDILSSELLKEMGWIDDLEKEIKEEDDTKIIIQHEPRPDKIYSNIPLHIMYERAKIMAPILEKLFETIPDEYGIPNDSSLQRMWKECQSIIKNPQKRVFYNGFSPEEYKRIRQKYLHFTATDALHSPGDLGNVPGRRSVGSYSDICRLLYRGGLENDNNVYILQDIEYGK